MPEIKVNAEISLSWDEELQGYYVLGITLPGDTEQIQGIAKTLWIYQEGKLVCGLTQ